MVKSSPQVSLRQISFESESWERLLAYYKQENLYFQFRLSEIINENDDPSVLSKVEKFYEDFLAQDFVTSFLLEELSKHNILLNQEPFPGTPGFHQLENNHQKLRSDFLKSESMFNEMKDNFFSFLDEMAKR